MFVSMILTTARAYQQEVADSRRHSHHTFADGNDFYGAPRTGLHGSDNSVIYQPPRPRSFTRPSSRLRESEDDLETPEQQENASV